MVELYSNESVFRGHPDKVCDQISSAILDACLVQDKKTRAGIEVVGGKGIIVVTGELTTKAKINVKKIVKRVLMDVGYKRKYKIINNLGVQSEDISLGVNAGGAGDQGIMFGYACDDTKQMLPLAMIILQEFTHSYDILRRLNPTIFFSDGKAQITGYYENNKLLKIKNFTISYNNSEKQRKKSDSLIKGLAERICKKYNIEIENFTINATGKFLIGGFEADSGLTGRKIVVDAYQGFARNGGGSMNGKDPTKADVSGNYIARELAKQLLKEYNLQWCEVQVSYTIGISKPMSINIKSNIGKLEPTPELYDRCSIPKIIKSLDLTVPGYENRARWGHFR